jgi:hypothetical protein
MSIYSPFKIVKSGLPQSIYYDWVDPVSVSTIAIYADCSFGYTGPLNFGIYLDDEETPSLSSTLQRAYGPQIFSLPAPQSASKLEIRFGSQAWSETLSISEIQIFSGEPSQDKLLTRYTDFSIDWRYQYLPSQDLVRFAVKNPPSGYTNWNVKLCEFNPLPSVTPEHIAQISGTFPISESGVSWEVPELDPGRYMLLLTMTGGSLDPVVEDRFFAKTESDWESEGALLGLEEVLLPGFTPLLVTENSVVNCTLRQYTQNAIGLWSQVKSKGKDLLFSPVRIEVRSEDTIFTASGSNLIFSETTGLNVVGSSSWVAGPVSGSTSFHYEQDGFMGVTLDIDSPTSTVDSLKLIIPFKESECYLFHPVGTGLRNHYAGKIPDGTGVVWSSDTSPSKLNDRFIPYVYVGGPETGICFAADNDKDWYPNSRSLPVIGVTSCMEIVRSAGRVELHLNILAATPPSSRSRSIKFGLMATPAKEKVQDWRKWWATRTSTGISDTHIDFWGSDLLWGGDSYATSFSPVNDSYDLFDRLSSYRDTGSRDIPWENSLLGTLTERPDYSDLDDHFKEGWNKATLALRNATKNTLVFPYTNSRGASYFKNKEFLDNYIDEWLSWDISDPLWGSVSVSDRPRRVHNSYSGDQNWYNVEPVESRADFLLWHSKKMLETFADGVHWDGLYLLRNFSQSGPGYEDDSGVPRAGVNLMAFRTLVKRCALMMLDMGLDPQIYIHATNACIVPVLSHASVSLDWAWRNSGSWAGRDAQDRMGSDLILAQSSGLQSGTVPVGMTGSMLTQFGSSTEEWLNRTGIAASFPHEIKMEGGTDDVKWVQEKLLEFGYGNQDCTVWRYWEPEPVTFESITSNGSINIKALVLSKNGEALILVGNWSSGRDSYNIRMNLDLQRLGLTPSIQVRDLEVASNRVIATNPKNTTVPRPLLLSSTGAGIFDFSIVHNDFALFRVDKIEDPDVVDPEPPTPPEELPLQNLLANSEEFELTPPWQVLTS